MNKKVIYGAIFTISLAFGGLNLSSVSAVDEPISSETVNQPIELSDDVDATDPTSEFIPGLIVQHGGEGGENGTLCLMEGDMGIPCPTECDDENGEFQPCVYNKETNAYTPYQTTIEEGTSGEPEVVCADESEPDCNTSDPTPEIVEEDGETETIDPELWPLILSLSSLGATVILVIIINIFGRKK